MHAASVPPRAPATWGLHSGYDVMSILVYPAGIIERRPDVAVYTATRPISSETDVAGLAFRGGPVVLTWDAVLAGAHHAHAGRNLVIHEMAHKIDFLDGAGDGTPPLPDALSRREWARVCSDAFLAHKARANDNRPSFMRDYAITNEAEFFAVASEVFFEQSSEMAAALPDLYAVLRDFYRIDLATRSRR